MFSWGALACNNAGWQDQMWGVLEDADDCMFCLMRLLVDHVQMPAACSQRAAYIFVSSQLAAGVWHWISAVGVCAHPRLLWCDPYHMYMNVGSTSAQGWKYMTFSVDLLFFNVQERVKTVPIDMQYAWCSSTWSVCCSLSTHWICHDGLAFPRCLLCPSRRLPDSHSISLLRCRVRNRQPKWQCVLAGEAQLEYSCICRMQMITVRTCTPGCR